MIYTSFYDNKPEIFKNKYGLISISRTSPSWYFSKRLLILAPDFELVHSLKIFKITRSEFKKEYRKQLDKLNVLSIVTTINELTQSYQTNKNPVLLCYERPENFCHRKIVSEWLNDNDIESIEL